MATTITTFVNAQSGEDMTIRLIRVVAPGVEHAQEVAMTLEQCGIVVRLPKRTI